MSQYDVVVIGGGPGGSAAAKQAARRGAKVCLAESHHLGGTCLNVGCIPTKAMLHGSEVLWQSRHMDVFGIVSGEPQVNGPGFMKRVRDFVDDLRAGLDKKMADFEGIDFVRGRGSLADDHAVRIEQADGEMTVSGESIVIASGSKPGRPGFLPWDSPRVMTSREAVGLKELPESILILGGGIIGCEFATFYAEMGVRTYLVEMMDRLLNLFPHQEASRRVRDSLEQRGVEVIVSRKLEKIDADDDELHCVLEDGRTIDVSHALIAVGRKAVLDDIGIERAGVETKDGIIPVDEHCRSNVRHIYAVGDVAEKRQFAHLAERMGRVAGENAAGYELRDDRRVVPSGVYTHPQVAMVGDDEESARSRCQDVTVRRLSLESSATAQAYDETNGEVKLVIDAETGAIYGGLWIGPPAIDLIHEVVLAMRAGLSLANIYQTVHAHPTLQEMLYEVSEEWVNERLRSTGAKP